MPIDVVRNRWVLPLLVGLSVLTLAIGLPLVAHRSHAVPGTRRAGPTSDFVNVLPALSGRPLLVGLVAGAIAVPLLLGLTWGIGRRQIVGAVVRVLAVVLGQVLAVSAVAVGANDHFGFYNSWSDIFGGTQANQVTVSQNALVPTSGALGRVVGLNVIGKVSGVRAHVLVWLPPQYTQRKFARTRFPALMMLTTQPGTPGGVFADFNFARNSVAAIDRHQVVPFVAVFPPIMIAPPRDTECTDVPHGPQAESWLATDVREAVVSHFRVSPNGQQWATAGLSTGGFCAAKLLLRHRTLFGAAAAVGGYFDAETDRSTGDLFGNSRQLRNENSPLWLIQHSGGLPTHLLIVVSKGDRFSWRGRFYADSEQMLQATTGYPGVAAIVLPSGGHSTQTYEPTFPATLGWLGRVVHL